MTLETFLDAVPNDLVGIGLTFIRLDGSFELFDSSRSGRLRSWWREQLPYVRMPAGKARIILVVNRATDEYDVVKRKQVEDG